MVVFYEINETTGEPGAPVLYLDTLKVSSIEQTADNTAARGGKGNSELVVWDFGKEITVNLEDALFSAKSMAIMFGNGMPTMAEDMSIMRTFPKSQVVEIAGTGDVSTKYEVELAPGVKAELTSPKFYGDDSKDTYDQEGTNAQHTFGTCSFVTGTIIAEGSEIEISASSFPGTYAVVGDTYARSAKTGKDEFFQFKIAKAKVQSENTITMEAEGDPSVDILNALVKVA